MTCNCYEESRAQLQAEGLQFSDKCKAMRVVDNKLSMHLGFPTQTTDGKKPKCGQATFVFLSFCPFCGKEYGTKGA